ncbi:uncharacterized protein LOC144578055 isoform X2 [Callithrix jacchus]
MGRFFHVAASDEISPISTIEEYSALDVYCSFFIPSSMEEQVWLAAPGAGQQKGGVKKFAAKKMKLPFKTRRRVRLRGLGRRRHLTWRMQPVNITTLPFKTRRRVRPRGLWRRRHLTW